jgi:hypothetical protein
MRQTGRSHRRNPDQGVFAPRQVYLRAGPTSHYVALSRSLQIAVAGGIVAIVLWLGLASYAAIAKHLETVEQGRELARLESVAKTLRTSVEEAQGGTSTNDDAAADADLVTELAGLRDSRERALMLADAAAGEADALRREVALAYERVRELELALVRTELAEASSPASLVGSRASAAERTIGGLEELSCAPR